MLNKKNNAFSIFYFALGLILFLPAISYANQSAVQDKKPVGQINEAQDDSSHTPSIRRLFNLKDGKVSLPHYSDIAIPVGPVAATPSQAQAKKTMRKEVQSE